MSGTTGERVTRARTPSREPRDDRPPRRILPVVLAVVAAVGLAGAAYWAFLLRGGEPAVTGAVQQAASERPAPAVVAVPASGDWQPLPDDPLPPRTEQAAVWAGSELVVWGGSLDDGFGRRTFLADGARLDPGTGVWEPLPEPPLEPRTDHLAAWTGSRLVVWGGTGRAGLRDDGAAYDPGSGTWEPLPPSPLSPRADAVGVWTGQELLVVGGRDLSGPLADGAAYDPATEQWRAIAELPQPFADARVVRGVAADGGALVWTADQGGLAAPAAARYRVATDGWEDVVVPVGQDAGLPLMASADGTLYALRASFDGTRADLLTLPPGAANWEERPAPTSYGDPGRASLIPTGQAVAIATGDPAASTVVFRLDTQEWQEVPPAPVSPGGEPSLVWSGSQLLVWSGAGQGPGAPSAAGWSLPAAAPPPGG